MNWKHELTGERTRIIAMVIWLWATFHMDLMGFFLSLIAIILYSIGTAKMYEEELEDKKAVKK